jgi:sec-independent protein translocase protein TatB
MLPNVGIGELMLVFVVALLVVGPQRLPEITRAAGKAWRTFQQETSKAKAALREVIDEPTNEFRLAFEDPARQVRETIEETRSVAGVIDRPDGSPGIPTPSGSGVDPHARTSTPLAAPPPGPAYDPLPLVRDYEDT